MNKFEVEHKYFSYGKNINIREVEISDAEFILELRCDNKLGRYINKTENNLQKQIEYLESYKKNDNEYYFIIENKDKDALGVYRLYDFIEKENSFCPGSWILKPGSPMNISVESVFNLYEIAFSGLGFDRAHLDVRKENLKVHKFHRSYGCKLIKETDLDYYFHFYKEQLPAFKEKYARYGPITLAKMDKHFK